MIHPLLVSDTGPMISFEKIPGGFQLLRRMIGQVLIPPQVLDELTAGLRGGDDYLQAFGLAGFVALATPADVPDEVQSLQTGERYAIALALSYRAPLLIEDWSARRVADDLGLTTTGALGILLQGHQQTALTTPELISGIEALRRPGRISRVLAERVMSEWLGQ